MILIRFVLYFVLILIDTQPIFDRETENLVLNTVKNTNHSIQTHTVTTIDGYEIQLHRVFDSKKNKFLKQTKNGKQKKVVLLVHGAFGSGAHWIMLENNSLSYMLADKGFDVWLINHRGTSYSLGHETLNTSNPKYWDFTWYEFGTIDLPNAIDYILDQTGSKNLQYVGHSQGCSVLLILLSIKPEYNEKIASAYFLAPSAFIHQTSEISKIIFTEIAPVATSLGIFKIQLNDSMVIQIIDFVCNMPLMDVMCSQIIQFIAGSDTNEIQNLVIFFKRNLKQLTFYFYYFTNLQRQSPKYIFKYLFDNYPIKQLSYTRQQILSEKFQLYDYGARNIDLYGSPSPPEYNLSQVTTKICIMYGTKDDLVFPKVIIFINKFLSITNI